jgi:hypothetical protein
MAKVTRLIVILFLVVPFCVIGQNVTPQPYELGEGLTLLGRSDYSIRLSGFVQPMVESRYYPEQGDQMTYQRFRLRRMVTKLTGKAGLENVSYQLQVDLTGSSDGGGDATTNNYLMDAWVAWQATKQIEIVFGQENAPTDSREMSIVSNALQLIDRSPVALNFASIREFGVFVNTNFRIGSETSIRPSFAITNGDGANVLGKDRGGLKIGGRIDFLPFGAFSRGGMYRQVDMERELTPKFVVGVTFSHNQGISDRRGRQSGTILYLDSNNNETLPDYRKFGVDFMFKYRGFSVSGEFLQATASVPTSIKQRVRTDGSKSSAFLVAGVQDVDAYVKSRMILGSGLNLQTGYLFQNGISVDGRYSKITPDTYSFLTNGTFNNRTDYYTLCLSKYLGRNFGAKLQAAVTYVKAAEGSFTLLGAPLIGNELQGSLMLTLAL